jgi:hypothetical protein
VALQLRLSAGVDIWDNVEHHGTAGPYQTHVAKVRPHREGPPNVNPIILPSTIANQPSCKWNVLVGSIAAMKMQVLCRIHPQYTMLYCDPNPIYLIYYGRSPDGLRRAIRVRRNTSTTLFRVRQERELFASIYSHK